MANYMLVDADKLEGDLKTVADSIRSKAGKSGEMKFPDEFKSVVDGIVLSSGVTVNRKTGTVTLVHEQNVTISCGFKPDVVFIKSGSHSDGGITYNPSTAMVFNEESRSNPFTSLYISQGIVELFWTRQTTGFSVKAGLYDYDWDALSAGSVSCDYVAIKYTN